MTATNESRTRDQTLVLVLAWLAVGAPLLWGVAQTISKAMALFGSR
jgi:hypothetical protein